MIKYFSGSKYAVSQRAHRTSRVGIVVNFYNVLNNFACKKIESRKSKYLIQGHIYKILCYLHLNLGFYTPQSSQHCSGVPKSQDKLVEAERLTLHGNRQHISLGTALWVKPFLLTPESFSFSTIRI